MTVQLAEKVLRNPPQYWIERAVLAALGCKAQIEHFCDNFANVHSAKERRHNIQHNDIQQNSKWKATDSITRLSIFALNKELCFVELDDDAECHYAECSYAECRYA